MKFQLTSDWSVRGGAGTIVAGTFLTQGDDGKWKALAPMTDVLSVPQPTPIDVPTPIPFDTVKALDQAAYDQLIAWYSPLNDNFLHLLHYAPGVQPTKGN